MGLRALLLLLAVPGCAVAPGHSAMSAARSLADAESAFAAHSVREGMRAAFIAHFAPDGVFTRDAWVVARDWLEPRPNPPIVLDWRPAHVEVAASGDFGLSTGPWKLTSKEKADAPPAYGQFISIWERTRDGPWKVTVDLGISHAGPALWDTPLQATSLPAARAAGTIAGAEEAFARDARAGGLRAAYAAHASKALRFYRPGEAPMLGLEPALAPAASAKADWGWAVERADTASSGDLGYARGRYDGGHYLRVWRAEDGRWRIVLDVINPLSKKPPGN